MGYFNKSMQQFVVKYEEKESRIREFIGRYLEELEEAGDDHAANHNATLIARSPDSPVARALISCTDDLHNANVALRIVFANVSPSDALSTWLDPSMIDADNKPIIDLRWAKNPAFLHAHEQFVLGAELCWSGDSMRREPSKRDAFELFEWECPEAVRFAGIAFEMLWSASVPVRSNWIAGNRRASTNICSGRNADLTGSSDWNGSSATATLH